MTNLLTISAVLMSLAAATLRIMACRRLESRAATRELVVQSGGRTALRAVATDHELSLELADAAGRAGMRFAYRHPTTRGPRPDVPPHVQLETGYPFTGWLLRAGSQWNAAGVQPDMAVAIVRDGLEQVAMDASSYAPPFRAGRHDWRSPNVSLEHELGLSLRRSPGTSLSLRAAAVAEANLSTDTGHTLAGNTSLYTDAGGSQLWIEAPDRSERMLVLSGPWGGLWRRFAFRASNEAGDASRASR